MSYKSRCARGATLVETAIGMPLFVLLLFGVIYLTLILYTKLALNHALAASVRQAVTRDIRDQNGQVFRDRYGNPLPIEEALKERIRELAGLYRISPPDTIRVCPLANLTCSVDDIGANGDFFQVSVSNTVHGALGIIKNIQVSRSARNEP